MPYSPTPSITQPLAVSPQDAATILNSSESSLEKDRAIGHLGIPYVKAGRKVIYRFVDLQAWLEEHRVTPRPEGYTK